MKRIGLLILLSLACSQAYSSITDCQGVYIGRIWIEKGLGLHGVVYLNHPDNSSGSYWSYFTGWTEEEKQAALSTLMMAKASKHRVNVRTENTDGCGLQDGYTVTKRLYLATNP